MRRAALILTCVGFALGAGLARADGDPASDVLLGENVFYPYNPAVSGPLQQKLNGQTAVSQRGGLNLKVALIASPVDLGVIPDVFGHPQQYASFLDQEISFGSKPVPLLVVMAAGYGTAGLTAAGAAAAHAVPRPAGSSSDALAQAASVAITRIDRAQNVRLGTPAAGAGSTGSSRLIVILLGIAALLVAAALALVTLGRWREGAGGHA